MKNKREILENKLLAICRFYQNGNNITEDEKYIYDEFEGLNCHETVEFNIKKFLELADLLDLFSTKEEDIMIARLNERLEIKDRKIKMYEEMFK